MSEWKFAVQSCHPNEEIAILCGKEWMSCCEYESMGSTAKVKMTAYKNSSVGKQIWE